eukprot:TRINITY_DN45903_c0_g1_i1.p1 TRINITY_DN45903_c0_g1~~TRINITY_DN45903_c0_g1_i1.p1  ORF type:complete len:1501 (-),score=365.88 TRINITY_DN45903_c0_g1_i1:479-4981(-)
MAVAVSKLLPSPFVRCSTSPSLGRPIGGSAVSAQSSCFSASQADRDGKRFVCHSIGYVGLGVALGACAQARRRQRASASSSRTVAMLAARRRGGKGGKAKQGGAKAKKGGVDNLEKFLHTVPQQAMLLKRFLADAPSSFREDYYGMEPMFDSPEADKLILHGSAPLNQLQTLVHRGVVHSVEYITTSSRGSQITLAVCNTDAGVVCGVGASTAAKRAKHLAAQQVLDRVATVDAPESRLLQVEDESGSAAMAADAINALQQHLEKLKLCLVQPCGGSWRAALQGEFMGRNLFCASPMTCSGEGEALAAVSEAFLQQIRAALRIPKNGKHAPKDWADSLQLEEVKTTVRLEKLGGSAASQSLLLDLLDDEEVQGAQKEALDAALARQAKRIAEIEDLMTQRLDAGDGLYEGGIARRCFEVTKPEDEDWRREDIKGVLPAEKIRPEISKALENHKAVIVSGGTGSGKSTQLPQFILDDFREWKMEDGEPLKLEVGIIVEVEFEDVWYACDVLEVAADKLTISAKYHEGGDEEPDIDVATRVRKSRPAWARMPPRIVVTQPRRIAATSLAERVAYERMQDVGTEIGYSVRGDTVFCESDTGTIEFCTVGTLLRRLVSDPTLQRYNVVVLDEVHERDLMTDFLLVLMKEVLHKRPDLRLILMSATLDVQTFVNYLPDAQVVEVPSATRYPVEEVHLDDRFFAKFPETKQLLEAERTGRKTEAARNSHYEAHEFSSIATNGNEKQDQVEEDEEADDDHDDEEEGEDEDEATAGINPGALVEQVRQLMSYDDEMLQAWEDHSLQVHGKKITPAEEDTGKLLEFLQSKGVRLWNADHASWEVISSVPWWGSEANDTSFLDIAIQTILAVVPDMRDVAADDEIGVGSILCFLPGWAEIKQAMNKLEKSGRSDICVLPLHSSVPKELQQQVFEPPPHGKVKVILATNIAESSVTINDVRVVVDSGLHRELTYDPRRRMSYMDTVWICQSNAVQRKGRAGRVRSGRVFRLYSRDQFESVPWRPAPEMQRCNLAQTCLQTIALRRDPREFLAAAPDPPMVAAVESAMAELKTIDAVKDGAPPTLLPVGQILCRMPLEPLLGRAMILGTLFGVPQTTAALLAVSAGNTAFIVPPEKKKEALANQKEFCDWSDTVAGIRALEEFERICKDKGFGTAKRWAQYYFVNFQRLQSFSRIKFQLLQDVHRSGLLNADSMDGVNPEDWQDYAEEQDDYDNVGAIFESDDLAPSGLPREEWLEELRGAHQEVDNEQILVALLCSAYPSNFAIREFPNAKMHKTQMSSKAIIDTRSVNANLKQKGERQSSRYLPSPSFWLYSDMRVFNGQVILQSTSLIDAWQLALFGGLRVRESPHLELDNWLTLQGASNSDNRLLELLRNELRAALTWIAISASYDVVAQVAVTRSKALFRILSATLVQEEADEEDIEAVRTSVLPKIEAGEATIQASEDQREELEDMLKKKTVAELKVLLREMGASLTGRKAELIERCADCLVYGNE